MARLDQNGVFFHHIPRTGGTWVEQAIKISPGRWIRMSGKAREGLPQKHKLISHYRFDQMYRLKYVFTFVRHPIGYYESVWKWLSIAGKASRNWCGGRKARRAQKLLSWHPKREACRIWDHDFSTWIRNMIQFQPCYVTRLYEQFCGPDGGEFCNYIGRMETLEMDFFSVMKIVGIEIKECEREIKELGIINPSSDMDVKWDDGLKKEMMWMERLAIQRFYNTDTADRRIYLDVEGESC